MRKNICGVLRDEGEEEEEGEEGEQKGRWFCPEVQDSLFKEAQNGSVV